MAAIVGFAHLITGFDNKTITGLMSSLLDQLYSIKRATYDLRQLRRKDLIERRPHSNGYLLTDRGCRVAVLFTKTYGRVLGPGLAALDPGLPADLAKRSPRATAWRARNRELDHHIDREYGDQSIRLWSVRPAGPRSPGSSGARHPDAPTPARRSPAVCSGRPARRAPAAASARSPR